MYRFSPVNSLRAFLVSLHYGFLHYRLDNFSFFKLIQNNLFETIIDIIKKIPTEPTLKNKKYFNAKKIYIKLIHVISFYSYLVQQ